jgi:hypothetical protein
MRKPENFQGFWEILETEDCGTVVY